MKSIHLIVNPAAGRGKAGKSAEYVKEKLETAGADYTLSFTSAPGEATGLAAKAAEDHEVVVAVGGDGTINEVVNGIWESPAALGIIPIGSGNDFIKCAGVPLELDAAVEVLLHGKVRHVDMGDINGHKFVNSVAMGIDAAVAETMNRASWMPSSLAYHYGVLMNVFFYRNRLIRWRAGDESGETRVNLASVMNGDTYGGSYNVAPGASINDGLLDMVIIGDYGVLGRIRHLPKLKSGRHMGLPKCTHRKAALVELSSEEVIPVAVDGDLFPGQSSGTHIRMEVMPNALKVISAGDD